MLDNLQKPCTKCGAPRDYTKHTWCSSCCRDYYVAKSGGMVQMSCKRCGDAFECTGRSARHRMFCTRECKEEARKESDKARRVEAKPGRNCLHCGEAMRQSMRIDAVYCGEPCNTAAHNAVRKASWKVGERQERVSRAYIIERDAGRCHLCGKRPKPSELHLDHVVPLARGGTHDAANIRVACARCNLSKRADSRGEQLLLIG